MAQILPRGRGNCGFDFSTSGLCLGERLVVARVLYTNTRFIVDQKNVLQDAPEDFECFFCFRKSCTLTWMQ